MLAVNIDRSVDRLWNNLDFSCHELNVMHIKTVSDTYKCSNFSCMVL